MASRITVSGRWRSRALALVIVSFPPEGSPTVDFSCFYFLASIYSFHLELEG
jgi:hypothetical protein